MDDAREWAPIEAAVNRLDGVTYTEVTINRCPKDAPSRADCDTVFLGGGEDDRVSLVFGSRVEGGVATFALAEPDRGDEIRTQTYGGQPTEMPARYWVSRRLALEALSYFIQNGGRGPGLVWELDTFEPD